MPVTDARESSLGPSITKRVSREAKATTPAFLVYIVQCADGTYYTGSTGDLAARLDHHNRGPSGAKYTRTRRPVSLVYVEAAATRGDALRREHVIKTLSRTAKRTLISSHPWLAGKRPHAPSNRIVSAAS